MKFEAGRWREVVENEKKKIADCGEVGTAHWKVQSRLPDQGTRVEIDGILVITLAEDGRCREHREWYSHHELPSAAAAAAVDVAAAGESRHTVLRRVATRDA